MVLICELYFCISWSIIFRENELLEGINKTASDV